jgi:hypothetical protein
MKYAILAFFVLASLRCFAGENAWRIGDDSVQLDQLMGKRLSYDAVKEGLIGSWAILHPARYGDNPRVGIAFKT